VRSIEHVRVHAISVTPIRPRLADLILMTDLRRGIVRTLSLTGHTVKPTPFRTLPRTVEYVLLSRIGIVHIGDPPNQVVLPLSDCIPVLYNPHNLQLDQHSWSIMVESRLGVLLHLFLANRTL